jgi:hypothetical protein
MAAALLHIGRELAEGTPCSSRYAHTATSTKPRQISTQIKCREV